MSKLCLDSNIPCHLCDNLPTCWIIRPWSREMAHAAIDGEKAGNALRDALETA